MKEFTDLFEKIDQTQSTNEKVSYIKDFFASCSDADGAWALFFLCGKRIKRLISSKVLLQWCCKINPLPLWLVEESYATVGDTAETLSLLLPRKEKSEGISHCLSEWMEKFIKPLQGMPLDYQEQQILGFWRKLATKEIFILNKILTGSFRMGISALLTLKGLSQANNISREILSQRLMGSWEPTATFFASLKSEEEGAKYLNPYPFYLAYGLEADLKTLGSPSDWVAEWKWDGIRAQAVVREDNSALWSRGNELISEQFPELITAFKNIPSGHF